MTNPVALTAYFPQSALPTYLGGRLRIVSPGLHLNLKAVTAKIDTGLKSRTAPKPACEGVASAGPARADADHLKSRFSGARSSGRKGKSRSLHEAHAAQPRPAVKTVVAVSSRSRIPVDASLKRLPVRRTATAKAADAVSRPAAAAFSSSRIPILAQKPAMAKKVAWANAASPRARLPVTSGMPGTQRKTGKAPWSGDRVLAQAVTAANHPRLMARAAGEGAVGQWRKTVRGFGADDLPKVDDRPAFSDAYLDQVLDSLPEDLVNDLADSCWDFGDAVPDLIDFLGIGDGVGTDEDFLWLDDGGADLLDLSGDDLIDFSAPALVHDYTPDLIGFDAPGDSRAWNDISDENFELDELMAGVLAGGKKWREAGPAGAGRSLAGRGGAERKLAEIAREAAHLGRLILNS